MTPWKLIRHGLRFSLGDLTLLTWRLPLQTHEVNLAAGMAPVKTLQPPLDELDTKTAGFLVRGLPVTGEQPRLSATPKYICYVQRQYRHFYIDMRSTFGEYKTKFSSKTRSTISRKVKKYVEHCNGRLDWSVYRTPEELAAFHGLARNVSALTYQERLLDAGLPGDASFKEEMIALAEQDRVRAYLLFDGEKPVSYLYCPIRDDVLIYAFLGYSPAYLKLSVGTILQWLALEQMFDERRFRYFDFTEGEADHKRLFASHELLAVNVLFLRRCLKHWFIVLLHRSFERSVDLLRAFLELSSMKTRIRRFIRFGHGKVPPSSQ